MNQIMWTKEQREKYAYSKEKRREYYRLWRIEHPELWKTQNKQYYSNHLEREKVRNKKNYQTHKEQNRERTKQWGKVHPEWKKENWQKWYKEHPEYSKEWNKQHPEQYRVKIRKMRAKRRKLGYIPFNEQFDGSEAHHIDFELVVYIPKELHRSVYHNVHTGQNIGLINDMAFEWLIEHDSS